MLAPGPVERPDTQRAAPSDSCAAFLADLGGGLLRDAALFPADRDCDYAALESALRERYRELAHAAAANPLANPVLALSLHLNRLLDEGSASLSALEQVVQRFTLQAFARRAQRAGAYLGQTEVGENERRIAQLIRALATDSDGRPLPFPGFRAALETPAFGVVFTAHPTFSITLELSRLLAQLTTGQDAAGFPLDVAGAAELLRQAAGREHRPPRDLTLDQEHRWSIEALDNALSALDRVNRVILATARELYPDEWQELCPQLLTLGTWVGYDLDGRSDITWRDTIGKRLVVKAAQLRRWSNFVAAMSLAGIQSAPAPLERLRLRLERAREAVESQQAALGRLVSHSPAKDVAAFSRLMVEQANVALTDTADLQRLLGEALAGCDDDQLRISLLALRAEMRTHGLGLAHTHVRLNATQVHNGIRSQIGLVTSPNDPTRRRSYVAAVNELLDSVEPRSVSYGSILTEDASARRLFMIVAQMVKHIDSDTPVRFLIAETESAFTLLAALYFARLFGVEDRVEISPLFETAAALNRGELIIDEALKSAHFRAYVERLGRLTIQFGFSDSGRYLGQMGATFVIERLRLRLADALARHGLTNVQLILFNTHGESIGRGAHPVSMADRFRYVAPPATSEAFRRRGIRVKEEISFQGGDGYLWFMHSSSALAVLRAALEDRLEGPGQESNDPIYQQSDYAAEFFNTVEQFFARVVADPDYAALLGVVGVNLLDRTGSRPVKRQADGGSGPVDLVHPAQLRAIPNNSVLQQLGMLANSIGGLGQACAKDPENLALLHATSARFRRAIQMVEYAASLSDPHILQAYLACLDPGFWLDRAGHAGLHADQASREELHAVSRQVETFGRHDRLMKIYRVFYGDFLLLRDRLRVLHGDTGHSSGLDQADREALAVLHAIRVALLQRMWVLATHVPEFSPQLGTTVEELIQRVIHLDVETVSARLAEIFPLAGANALSGENFGEHATYLAESHRSYEREHQKIFEPIAKIFVLMRRIGAVITYHAGAVG